jgi:hypothetical protein
MPRKAVLVDQNNHSTTLILIDTANAKDILPYVFSEGIDKEFKEIRQLLKENLRNQEKYRKVDVSDRAKNMYEMRFIKNDRNDRIYCQENSIGGKRVIIMVELFQGKKTQEIPKKIKGRIETMGGYQYELEY